MRIVALAGTGPAGTIAVNFLLRPGAIAIGLTRWSRAIAVRLALLVIAIGLARWSRKIAIRFATCVIAVCFAMSGSAVSIDFAPACFVSGSGPALRAAAVALGLLLLLLAPALAATTA